MTTEKVFHSKLLRGDVAIIECNESRGRVTRWPMKKVKGEFSPPCYEFTCYCPTCGEELDMDMQRSFCECCGQALDWSEVEGE